MHVADVDAKAETLDIASGEEILKEKMVASLLEGSHMKRKPG